MKIILNDFKSTLMKVYIEKHYSRLYGVEFGPLLDFIGLTIDQLESRISVLEKKDFDYKEKSESKDF